MLLLLVISVEAGCVFSAKRVRSNNAIKSFAIAHSDIWPRRAFATAKPRGINKCRLLRRYA